MRLSFRKIAKCCALLILITLFSLIIRNDGPLFTEHFPRFDHVRELQTTTHKTGNDSNRHHILVRTQRSAKSVEAQLLNKYQRGHLSNVGILEDKPKRILPTALDDIFISVKTTGRNHKSRTRILLETWISFAKNQTYIFTDEDDVSLTESLPAGHVINTNCSSDHSRRALNCKMAQEFDLFVSFGRRWWCHVDDDTYVNPERLVWLLRRYNHTQDWYLGKPSLGHPIEVMDRSRPGQMMAFWFATGGAGFCISRALALKMIPHAGGGRLIRAGEHIRLPDDCTIGYVVNNLLRRDLTVIEEFHSHLEPLAHIQPQQIADQITFGYLLKEERTNVVNVRGFPEDKDPTRIVADTLIYGTRYANRVDPDETAPTGAVSSWSTLFANTSNYVTMRQWVNKIQTF